MVTRLLAGLALGAVVLTGWGSDCRVRGAAAESGQTRTADDAYQEAVEKRRAVEPIEERLAITKAFLKEFQESKYTARAISAVVYYQGEKLGDMEGAVAYAEAIREEISDPGIAIDLDKEMIPMYGEAGMTEKMLAVADRLAAEGELDFGDHWNVIESAVTAADWRLVRDYCEKAKGMANAEAFRADYPDREFTDEEVAEAADNRAGMLLVKDGWARANQGEIDAALAGFAKADGLVKRSYLDVPEYDLDLHWANTLVMKGDYEGAVGRFAVQALVMRNEEALAGLKKAYVGIHGSESGFDAYAAEMHRSVAKTIEDFELADYEGRRHRFSDLRGNVTLVAFWFPT